jgi:hypothetical protein
MPKQARYGQQVNASARHSQGEGAPESVKTRRRHIRTLRTSQDNLSQSRHFQAVNFIRDEDSPYRIRAKFQVRSQSAARRSPQEHRARLA